MTHQDRKTWRFDQIAVSVTDRVEPGDTDLEYYVGLEHLDGDSLKIRRWGSPSDVIGQKLGFRKGDIIFGKRRAYQRKLAVADFDGICSAHAMVLRAKPDVVLPEFLLFFMQSDLFMNRAVEISVGSLSPTINWKTLAAQEFALPPLEEQRRIAEVLMAVDAVINDYSGVIEAELLLRKSIQENRLLVGSNRDDFHTVRIDAIAEVNPREPALPNNAPFVPMEAVDEWNRTISRFEERNGRGGVRARSGDVLMARITPCLENGKTAQVPNSIERCGGSTEFIVLRAKEGISSDLVFWVSTAPSIRHKAIGLMHGSTGRQRLAANDFARLRISLAPRGEAIAAVELLNKIEEEHELILSRIEQIRRLKSSFLSEHIRGAFT